MKTEVNQSKTNNKNEENVVIEKCDQEHNLNNTILSLTNNIHLTGDSNKTIEKENNQKAVTIMSSKITKISNNILMPHNFSKKEYNKENTKEIYIDSNQNNNIEESNLINSKPSQNNIEKPIKNLYLHIERKNTKVFQDLFETQNYIRLNENILNTINFSKCNIY